ncbi:MAG: chemotaxis protein CheX [Polyangiales bacterium]
MSAAVREKVIEALTEVLETSAFVTVSPWADNDVFTDDVWEARVSYHGQARGEMRLWIDAVQARDIASNLLALDGPDAADAEQLRDVVGEVANMVCGAALLRIHPESLIDLDAPRVSPGASAESDPTVRVRGDCGAVAVTMSEP